MCGYKESVTSIKQLYTDAKTVVKKFKEDDQGVCKIIIIIIIIFLKFIIAQSMRTKME